MNHALKHSVIAVTAAVCLVPFTALHADSDSHEKDPGQTPFTGSCVATGVPSEILTPNCSVAVPAGKRLVVKFVSAQMYFNSGKLGLLAIDYLTNGTAGRQLYNPVDAGVLLGGIQNSVVSSPADLSADPGTAVKIWFFAANGSTVPFGGSGYAWVTGYLTKP
jgi:hypothetical protein